MEDRGGKSRIYAGQSVKKGDEVVDATGTARSDYGNRHRIANGFDPKKLRLFDVKWVQDFRGNDFLLFNSEWHIRHTLENNEELELVEFGS